MYYDRQGKKISCEEWMEYCNSEEYRVVKQDLVNHRLISTVWVGMDMNIITGSDPLIFETMIFLEQLVDNGRTPKNLDKYSQYICRYSTEQQALEGHKMFVDMQNMVDSVMDECRGEI